MKKYWLILDPYVFIWGNSNDNLIYNCLSGKGFITKKTIALIPILSALENKSNMYCISITDLEWDNLEIKKFIANLREYFCGDLLDKSIFPQKPLVVIPEQNIDEETFRKNNHDTPSDRLYGIHAIKTLLEVDIYLTGECNLFCEDCSSISKQISWCCKNEDILSIQSLKTLLSNIKRTSTNEVRFFGGNLLSYPYWSELMILLNEYSFKKSFYINYRTLYSETSRLKELEQNGCVVNILVDYPFDKKIIFNKQLLNYSPIYIFRVKSLDDYYLAEEIINTKLLVAKILPYYNGENLSFFKEYVFQNKEDIINTVWSKNEIFAHMTLNTFDFGKLIILPNGTINSNINFDPIGDIYNSDILDLVNEELKNSKAWFRTRNTLEPCAQCLFKYLCPSPSNYELAIGLHNLCNTAIY